MVLLVSTYDLGRQPFGLASAAAALAAAGYEVRCADLAKQKLDGDEVRRASAIAFFLPMHTATRLALPVIDRVRHSNPRAQLIAYGLYAPLNARLLRERGVTSIIGGEFEDALVTSVQRGAQEPAAGVPRVTFRVPDRTHLLPLARYATLQMAGERRIAGYTEASRGCKHRCRHCPIVPVYDGRFRVVPAAVVMADVAAQVASGARHITFGDPDFFNGIGHAKAIMDAFAREHADVSYDVTIKIEHLLEHADCVPLLKASGCAFVTSAVESVDDDVLRALDKGHTRNDFERVVERFRHIGLPLAPTFVAFTPWSTIEGYC
ncbi:MAG TPA: radical SAM protein, partial [Vicinamibacterales bacterium]|nr:radical SAM protein [Vicinamibacterales bacterium]